MSMAAKRIIKQQKCTLSEQALIEFLRKYPMPKEVKIMLPNNNQNIFDAPAGYVGLYVHAFTESNFRIPIHPLILEFLQYYQVHISRLNPFGLAKLTTYIVVCKAYGYEPMLNVLRGFINLCPGGDWLTLGKRSEPDVPCLITKPFANIRKWKGLFFYVQDTIIPPKYPALLDKDFRFDEKRFDDPLPHFVRSYPLYQRLERHPFDVQTFPEPILFMAGIVDHWEGSPLKPGIMCEGKSMYIPIQNKVNDLSDDIYLFFFVVAGMAFRNFVVAR